MHIHRAYAPPAVQTRRYEAFLGVDFSTDPSRVDPRRSPWAPNLISDAGGFPEKRPGYETLMTLLGGPVNGLYGLPLAGGEEVMLIHAGTFLKRVLPGNKTATLMSSLPNVRSCGFTHRGRLWLLMGGRYLVAEADAAGVVTVTPAREAATVPTTSISRDPAGGGTPLEPVNLLTPWRKNSFLGTAGAVRYQLDAGSLDTAKLTATVNGLAKAEGTGFSVDRTTGVVTFVAAPGAPAVTGADNVVITFSRTVPGYAERIEGCLCGALFGGGSGSYLFVGGAPERPNYDWRSALDDPSWFPDTGYTAVGGDRSAIMGYLRLGEQLAVVKAPSQGDSTVFLRTAEHVEGQGMLFPLRAGVGGVGAVSRQAILSLRDDPLFLSPAGLFALTARSATLERTVQSRSSRVDPRLTAEEGLERAVATEWGNYLIIAVNERCYVADARQQSPGGSDGSFEYEWYHWDSVPACCFRAVGTQLWFGTRTGRLCIFRDDPDVSRYADDAAPIVASWSTKLDDDGDFMRLKTLPRRGAGVLIKPYTRSSVRVLLRIDGEPEREETYAEMDIFDFNDIDFTRLSFSTDETPQAVPFSGRARRYRVIQVIVENRERNEGFGVFGILRRYTLGRWLR